MERDAVMSHLVSAELAVLLVVPDNNGRQQWLQTFKHDFLSYVSLHSLSLVLMYYSPASDPQVR